MPSPAVVPRVAGGPQRFPDAVTAELAARRSAILARAEGRILDLSTVGARGALVAASMGEPGPERFDTVVSVAELMRFPDLLAAARGMVALLAPGGRIEVVEPVQHVSVGHRVVANLWAGHPAVRHRFVERDVVETLWFAGLTLSDLERFVMPTVVWPLRQFAHARGRIVAPMSDGDERGSDAGPDDAGAPA
jgi:SAM-dependent methyltransferase